MADYKIKYTGEQVDSAIDFANKLYANLGIGRWANQTFISYWTDKYNIIYDSLAPYYTDATRMFANSSWGDLDWVLNDDYLQLKRCTFMFYNTEITNAIYLSNMVIDDSRLMFKNCTMKKCLIKENCKVTINGRADEMFGSCVNLEEIGELDFSGVTQTGSLFQHCSKLKSIHIKHWRVSFDINVSTAFEQEDLVEIISNLDEVTSVKTLTMGATNLAKLTEEQIKVATDKGWVLA